jgi:hypothetical protein
MGMQSPGVGVAGQAVENDLARKVIEARETDGDVDMGGKADEELDVAVPGEAQR